MWSKFISSYLSFTKKERRGIILLLVLMVIFTIAPFLFPYFTKEKIYSHAVFQKEIALLKIKKADSNRNFSTTKYDDNEYQNNYRQPEKKIYTQEIKGELFYFNPNTASTSDWQRLGIRDKTIATIQNYILKGGKFYKPEDIGKIWGLHEAEVKRLLPYIKIEKVFTDSSAQRKTFAFKTYENKTFDKPVYKTTVIDVNAADTTELIALPGIGSKLAQRIITFRDKLGGFYKPEQVAETFGLPDSTFQKIKPRLIVKNATIKTININTATIDEMKTHPYLRYNIANAILQYRTQHGGFAAVDDLKKIVLVTDDVYNKVAPYISTK